MPSVNNTLGHQFTVSTVSGTVDIDTFVNVLKRREEIVYRSTVPPGSANIAFIGGVDITSETNLSINDRSSSLIANRNRDINHLTITDTDRFTINTEDFLLTDIYTDETETISSNPLFYKHTISTTNVPRDTDDSLDSNVSLVEVKVLDSLFQAVNLEQLSIDYDTGVVYNNLLSEWKSTSDFTIYYIKYTVNNNGTITTHTDLLDNTKIYTVATFDDLNPDLTIITGRKVYLIEESGTNFNITLPATGTYSYKPFNESRIQIVPPVSSTSSEPWFVRISNGTFLTEETGSTQKYRIAEFLTQSFSPEPPIKYIVSEESTVLNKTIVKLDHENIYESTDDDLYVSIQLTKSDGTGVAAFTTDSSLVGDEAANGQTWTEWSNSTRYGIKSVDHRSGFVDIEGLPMNTGWTATSTYYYEEDKYEFTTINFNPISNIDIVGKRVAFFIDPETVGTPKDETLYYLIADETGRVTESSWGSFDNDTQETTAGRLLYYDVYPSWRPTEDHDIFIDNTVEAGGLYLVLGEVTVAPASRPALLSRFDSRRRGGGIIDTYIDTVEESYPESKWVWDEGYWDGTPYPGNASYFVEVPVDVLDDAGGTFTQQEVRDIVNKHTAAGVYPVVKGYGIDISVSGIYPLGTSITLQWSSDEY